MEGEERGLGKRKHRKLACGGVQLSGGWRAGRAAGACNGECRAVPCAPRCREERQHPVSTIPRRSVGLRETSNLLVFLFVRQIVVKRESKVKHTIEAFNKPLRIDQTCTNLSGKAI